MPKGTFRDCKRSPRSRAGPDFGSSPVQKKRRRRASHSYLPYGFAYGSIPTLALSKSGCGSGPCSPLSAGSRPAPRVVFIFPIALYYRPVRFHLQVFSRAVACPSPVYPLSAPLSSTRILGRFQRYRAARQRISTTTAAPANMAAVMPVTRPSAVQSTAPAIDAQA